MTTGTMQGGRGMAGTTRYMLVALGLALAMIACGPAQQDTPATADETGQNVVLIVSDGIRWQEVFRGADPTLIDPASGGVRDTAALRETFVRPSAEGSREALFPFLWRMVETEGRIYGDRDQGQSAVVTNGMNFSYPGYSEMVTGVADPRIDSNEYPPNPNINVFEWLARQPGFEGRVGVFGTWEAFGRIFNRDRAGIPVHAAWEVPFQAGSLTAEQEQINRLYARTTRLWGSVAYDSFMQEVVLSYLRDQHPRALFVGYGETDEWAHSRRYDQYLTSARRFDGFVEELWTTMQAMPEYSGRTTFVITTDHGRGGGPSDWGSHGADIDGAENIWIAVIGPGADALVPVTTPATQSQVAATVAALVGEDFQGEFPAAGGALVP